jgi:hypothetical protein
MGNNITLKLGEMLFDGVNWTQYLTIRWNGGRFGKGDEHSDLVNRPTRNSLAVLTSTAQVMMWTM